MDGRLTSLMQPDLERSLREQVSDRAALRHECSTASVKDVGDLDAGARAALTDGQSMDVDQLVGADDPHSRVPELLLGPDERFVRYLDPRTMQHAATHTAVATAPCSPTPSTGSWACRPGDGRAAMFTVHRNAHRDPPADQHSAIQTAYSYQPRNPAQSH